MQIVNGLGATSGYPTDSDVITPGLATTNSTDNLVVGYNELGNPLGVIELVRTIQCSDTATIS
ncbi:MAG: hypothetical protein ACI835_004232 [Planctomycetota bacterium]|jgi:hypothetical protein